MFRAMGAACARRDCQDLEVAGWVLGEMPEALMYGFYHHFKNLHFNN